MSLNGPAAAAVLVVDDEEPLADRRVGDGGGTLGVDGRGRGADQEVGADERRRAAGAEADAAGRRPTRRRRAGRSGRRARSPGTCRPRRRRAASGCRRRWSRCRTRCRRAARRRRSAKRPWVSGRATHEVDVVDRVVGDVGPPQRRSPGRRRRPRTSGPRARLGRGWEWAGPRRSTGSAQRRQW